MKRHIVPILLLCVVSFAVFANTFGNPFIWDDEEVIQEGKYIKRLNNIPYFFTPDYWKQFYFEMSRHQGQREEVAYRPVYMASFAVDYFLWGLDPRGYHMTNLTLHMVNVVMIYLFILGLAKPAERSGGFLSVPLLTALFFATHPMHTESIAWIKNRSDILALIFFIWSILLFKRCFLGSTKREALSYYAASLLAFVLALLSKAMAITLPVILAVHTLLFIPKERVKPAMLGTVPFFALTAAFIFFKATLQGAVGSAGVISQPIGLYRHILIVIKTVDYYLRLLILPLKPQAVRFFAVPDSIFDPSIILLLTSLAVLSVFIAKRYRKNRLLSYSFLLLFITLIPVSNLIILNSRPIADQRLYMPSFGFCALLAIVLNYLYRLELSNQLKFMARRSVLVLAIGILITYSFTTIKRNLDWRDPVLFWSKALESPYVSNKAYANLGVAYYRVNRYQEAIESYIKAINIDPGDYVAYNSLGITYRDMMGHSDEAMASFRKAIELKPDYAEAYNNLGGLLFQGLGSLQEAERVFKKAVEIEPSYARAFFNLGLMRDLSGDPEGAVEYYLKAIRLDPEVGAAPYNNLAYIFLNANRVDDALKAAEKALSIEPENGEAMDTLGWVYFKKGRVEDALRLLENAALLLPDNREVQGHLEVVREAMGQRE
ncbi:MAG: tetratricopeptide repeat protein [Candidatus Omnitrophota bacterium]